MTRKELAKQDTRCVELYRSCARAVSCGRQDLESSLRLLVLNEIFSSTRALPPRHQSHVLLCKALVYLLVWGQYWLLLLAPPLSMRSETIKFLGKREPANYIPQAPSLKRLTKAVAEEGPFQLSLRQLWLSHSASVVTARLVVHASHVLLAINLDQ